MVKLSLVLLTVGCLLVLMAAPSSIGIVKSTGGFRVNGSAISGNGTLFEGDQLETSAARSVVQLGVTQITLLPQSRAHVFHNRTVLEQGSELLSGAPGLSIEAATLRISAAAKASMVQVELSALNRVSVAAREGSAEVRNSSGLLIARLSPGVALAFDPQPQGGASTVVKVTGKLEFKDGKFLLTDCTTDTRVELRGTDLLQYNGKTIEVTGSDIPNVTLPPGVIQVVQVVTTASAAACKVGAAPPSGGRSFATAAIVGGVAVAGALVGLAAAGTFSGATTSSIP